MLLLFNFISYLVLCPSHPYQAGFNLVVCYYALGDVDLMKRGFQRLLQVSLPDGEAAEDAERGASDDDDAAVNDKLDMSRDVLKEELKARQKAAVASIANAAKLIAPIIDTANWVAGFDWVIEQLRIDHGQVASELQICKALQFLQVFEWYSISRLRYRSLSFRYPCVLSYHRQKSLIAQLRNSRLLSVKIRTLRLVQLQIYRSFIF